MCNYVIMSNIYVRYTYIRIYMHTYTHIHTNTTYKHTYAYIVNESN